MTRRRRSKGRWDFGWGRLPWSFRQRAPEGGIAFLGGRVGVQCSRSAEYTVASVMVVGLGYFLIIYNADRP